MLSYEVLDFIADCYIPLLIIYALLLIGLVATKKGLKLALTYLLVLGVGIIPVYIIWYLDNRLRLWSALELDYSTHTALALTVVVYLVIYKQKYVNYFVASLMAYGVLMLYQQYHSLLDIITTTVVILPVVLAIFLFGKRKLLLSLV
ncbi:hypothetical protein H0A36_24700 [Endozoicomonas sp. SM1973]|uniref:Phosphatidic acid phosphatase type 2/haloperoxidase domain-containing protein n=1 Tax=Spartinivicinus marinus TaxID=2994442 RepID=A0A853IBK8_9GAMM|nr:hypothetical protein [Spartinivicinus marinus]MCX4027373.1 hypothetical protein [Spartinivicinus marinus]NYZ69222.1 hypothetical protein [Spartinivicinus marinus]